MTTSISGYDESDSLIMPRAKVKESSWLPPSAAQLAWDDMNLLDWDDHIDNPPKPKDLVR